MEIDAETMIIPNRLGAVAVAPDNPFWHSEGTADEIHLRIPAAPEYIRFARELVECLNEQMELPDEVRAAIKLAVGEAVNNAVHHAQPRPGILGRWVDVTIRRTTAALEIDVVNYSNGFQPETPSRMPPAELLAEGGRGIALMEMMMDEVAYFTHHGETIVRMKKFLPRN